MSLRELDSHFSHRAHFSLQSAEVFIKNFNEGEQGLCRIADAPKDGRYRLFNVGTGRFLDVSGSPNARWSGCPGLERE